MGNEWEELLCRVYRAGYEDCQRERDYDPMGNEVVDAARIRAEKIGQRIFEAALRVMRDPDSGRRDEEMPQRRPPPYRAPR